MRARMLVDARRADLETDYKVGQELEGAEAEYQVLQGHAEVIEADPDPKKKDSTRVEQATNAPGEKR